MTIRMTTKCLHMVCICRYSIELTSRPLYCSSQIPLVCLILSSRGSVTAHRVPTPSLPLALESTLQAKTALRRFIASIVLHYCIQSRMLNSGIACMIPA